MSEPDQEGGGRVETAVAFVICAAAMLGPIIYIQHGYESFMGDDKIVAGAAGATLALAVVMRTVSRTVLRTIVRTSARAGLKASMKGALQAGTRVAARGLFASMFKSAFGEKLAGTGPKPTEPAAIRKANLKSLVFASGLLYASWIIVIGLGNPFGTLLAQAEAGTLQEQERRVAREALANPNRRLPEWDAFDMQVEITAKRRLLAEARRVTKGARTEGQQLAALMGETTVSGELGEMTATMVALLVKSNGKIREKPKPEPEFTPGSFENALNWLYTHAPFPGGSLVQGPIPVAVSADATLEGSEAGAATTPVHEWVVQAGRRRGAPPSSGPAGCSS
jgi:hypothetical protein